MTCKLWWVFPVHHVFFLDTGIRLLKNHPAWSWKMVERSSPSPWKFAMWPWINIDKYTIFRGWTSINPSYFPMWVYHQIDLPHFLNSHLLFTSLPKSIQIISSPFLPRSLSSWPLAKYQVAPSSHFPSVRKLLIPISVLFLNVFDSIISPIVDG